MVQQILDILILIMEKLNKKMTFQKACLTGTEIFKLVTRNYRKKDERHF